ncbi:uncharacterized protein LOC134669544 [Cydia fagiglandana]|uniref:uncharacterized protein LOC134669544 n=1 Tax=Cydia fagiglandana TaxID=1458189 RepID=UPI002FEE5D6B
MEPEIIGDAERQSIIEILELYKDFPWLWDLNHAKYFDKDARSQSFEVLLECYQKYFPNTTVTDIRKKIEYLRSCYRRERKKVESSKTTGAGSTEIYQPNLWYYPYLNFLQEKTVPTTVPVDNFPTKDVEEPVTKKERKTLEKKQSAIFKKQEDLLDSAKELLRSPDESSEDAFGRSIIMQLKELTKIQKCVAERLISEVLFYAKLGELSINTTLYINKNHTPSPSPQHSSPSPQYFPPSSPQQSEHPSPESTPQRLTAPSPALLFPPNQTPFLPARPPHMPWQPLTTSSPQYFPPSSPQQSQHLSQSPESTSQLLTVPSPSMLCPTNQTPFLSARPSQVPQQPPQYFSPSSLQQSQHPSRSPESISQLLTHTVPSPSLLSPPNQTPFLHAHPSQVPQQPLTTSSSSQKYFPVSVSSPQYFSPSSLQQSQYPSRSPESTSQLLTHTVPSPYLLSPPNQTPFLPACPSQVPQQPSTTSSSSQKYFPPSSPQQSQHPSRSPESTSQLLTAPSPSLLSPPNQTPFVPACPSQVPQQPSTQPLSSLPRRSIILQKNNIFRGELKDLNKFVILKK